MQTAANKTIIDAGVLAKYAADLLMRRGVEQKDAEITVDNLVSADLRGIDTHGVMRLAVYLKRMDLGLLEKENKIRVVDENDNMAVIDGGNYLGPVAASLAMEKAMEKAKNRTVGLAFVRNNHHYGSCAYYSMMALKEDMIGFTTTNTLRLMAPTGGKQRMVGNNPFSFAAPAGKYQPFVLDIAMSVVAGGKIILAQKNGEKIPLGWALNKDGEPTQDAYEGFAGGGLLLPVGGHKGYGMAVMLDILSGVLSGSVFGAHIKGLEDYKSEGPMGTGHFMAAINVDAIIGAQAFKSRMDQLIGELKETPKAQGVEEIFVPGEIEFRTSEKRKKEGIPISPAVVKEMEEMGSLVGMPPIEKIHDAG